MGQGGADPDRVQQPHRHQVARMDQRLAQPGRPEVLAAVVLRAPFRAHAGVGKHDRRVIDDRRRGIAGGDGRGINKRLETRAGLSPGLGRAVEFIPVKIKPAREREDAPVIRAQRDQRALHLGQLRQDPVSRLGLQQPDHIARRHDLPGLIRRGPAPVCTDMASGPLQALPAHGDRADAGQPGVHGTLADPGDDGRIKVAEHGETTERLLQRLAGHVVMVCDLVFGAAVAVPPVVGAEGRAQGLIGGQLVFIPYRGADGQPAGIGRFAIFGDQVASDHLGDIRGLKLDCGPVQGGRDGGRARRAPGRIADERQGAHPFQHIVAPRQRPLGTGDWIGGRRGLGQAGDHRGLGQGQFADILAVVNPGGRADAIGPLAEVNLVEVEFEDLVLVQFALNLERQKDLVQLPDIGLFTAQEEISCDLHGDRAAALFFRAGPGQFIGGPQQALPVHPWMGVKLVVFGGQKGPDHLFGDYLDPDRRAPLFAEFGDQGRFRAVNPERHLHFRVPERVNIRQAGHDIPGRNRDRDDG